MIISQPKTSSLGVVFDVDHDSEGPRGPKAHLGTVNRNLSHHLGRPFTASTRTQGRVSVDDWSVSAGHMHGGQRTVGGYHHNGSGVNIFYLKHTKSGPETAKCTR